jgi:hypothetical protein
VSADPLDTAHLSFVSRGDDPELARIRETIAGSIAIDGRAELEASLCELLTYGRSGTRKTLDLIGHSTADGSLLVLGDWVIDAASATVAAFFRELADHDVFARLGVHAIRLLGCGTAGTDRAKWTVCRLAEIVGIEVYGATGPLLASYYDAVGFADERRYVLAPASQLHAGPVASRPPDRDQMASAHALDIDALAPTPVPTRPWPVHVVEPEQARELLALIHRREGTMMPSLDATPSCELALASSVPGRYHPLEVLLDGELVRAFPAGATHGVVYPVHDTRTFSELIGYLRRS